MNLIHEDITIFYLNAYKDENSLRAMAYRRPLGLTNYAQKAQLADICPFGKMR